MDINFLQHALRIAVRGLGRTWPNPSVGCVLVKDGGVIAAACTAETGRPHAETQALALAGDAARGATAYVTLEPCAHHGQTPPCAQALIDAGIARMVIGAMDPDPRVNGHGAVMLEHAGIRVDRLLLPEAIHFHRGFFRRVTHGLPYVAMKLATSLDGKIADAAGHSQWITDVRARTHGQMLRGQFDAVVTGIGTVLADDPQLTLRLPGTRHERLVRVVCDRRLRLPLASQLVHSAEIQPTWVLTTAEAVEQMASHATDLREAGVKICVMEDGTLQPHAMLTLLAREGLTRVLVEAGAGLSTAFLAARCVDRLYWYRSAILLGNNAMAAIGPLQGGLTDALHGLPMVTIPLGDDHCELYDLPSCLPD